MSKRNWSKLASAVGAGLIVAGCSEYLLELPEGPLKAPECKYEQASRAAGEAAEEYAKAEKPPAKAPVETVKAFEEKRRAAEAAERSEQQAEECEARVREWSDLSAQWQSARAAINMARAARNQITWTILEIVALLATVGVGVWAILAARAASNRDFKLLKKQVDDGRREADVTQQIGQAQVRAYLSIANAKVRVAEVPDKDGVWFSGFEIEFTIKNSGQSPARSLNIEARGIYCLEPGDLGVSCRDERSIEDVTANSERPTGISLRTALRQSDRALNDVSSFSVELKVEGKDVFGDPVATSGRFYCFWDQFKSRIQSAEMSPDVKQQR